MSQAQVHIFEAVWVLAALVGAAASFRTLREALGDQRFLTTRGGDSARRIVARAAVRRARVQVVTLSIFAMLGIVLLIQPTLQGRGVPPSVIQFALLFAFCFAVVQISATSLMDRRDRRTLLNEMQRGSTAR